MAAAAVIALGVAAPVVGFGIGGPTATALGFLVFFAAAVAGLPLLVVGAVMWASGAREKARQPRPGDGHEPFARRT